MARPLGTLAWADLKTPDLDAAAAVYSRLLGWELQSDDTTTGRYVVGTVGAGPVAGMMASASEQASPSVWAVFFGFAEVAATSDQAVS